MTSDDDDPWGIEIDEDAIKYLKSDPVFFSRKICQVHPYWYQEELLLNDAKEIVARLGRQLGKTWAMALKVVHEAFTKPGVGKDEPFVIMIIAPTQRQSQIMFKEIQKLINSNPIILQDVERSIQTEITFKNGSIIYNFPVGETADRVRGYAINLLIVDEAAYVPDQVFVSLEPALAATDGKIILISTPFGRFGYFYDAVSGSLPYTNDDPPYGYIQRKRMGLTGISIYDEDDDDKLIKRGLYDHEAQFVSHWYPYGVGLDVIRRDMKGKPTGRTQMSHRIIERNKRKMHPSQFAQEFEALFVDDSTMYFPFKILLNATEDYPMVQYPEPGKNYYMGVDFAKLQDFYVALIVEAPTDESGPMRVVNWMQERKRDYSITIPLTAQLAKRFGCVSVYADQTGVGEPNTEKLTALLHGISRVEGIKFTSQKKNEMYANLYELIGSGKLILPGINKEFMEQMQMVTFEKLPSGIIRIGAAPGHHDDYPDALALAMMSTMEPRYEAFFGGIKSVTSPQIEARVQKELGVSMISRLDRRVLRDSLGRVQGTLPWEIDDDDY